MAEKKSTKKAVKKESSGVVYVITKANGSIERTDLSDDYIKHYEGKGYSVKKKGDK